MTIPSTCKFFLLPQFVFIRNSSPSHQSFEMDRLEANTPVAIEHLWIYSVKTKECNRGPFSYSPNIWIAIITQTILIRSKRAPVRKTMRTHQGCVCFMNLIAHTMNFKNGTLHMKGMLTYVSCKRHILNRFSTLNGNIKAYHNTLCCCVYVPGRPYALFIFLFRSSRRLWSTSDSIQLLFHSTLSTSSVLISTSWPTTYSLTIFWPVARRKGGRYLNAGFKCIVVYVRNRFVALINLSTPGHEISTAI